MGTIGHAYISVNDADLYIVSGFDAAVGTQAATIRAFVAAGGGLLVGNQVRQAEGGVPIACVRSAADSKSCHTCRLAASTKAMSRQDHCNPSSICR